MLAFSVNDANSQAFPGANPNSSHPIDWCWINDSQTGSREQLVTNMSLNGALSLSCSNTVQAESHGNDIFSWAEQCTPDLPIPVSQAGGEWAGFSVNGTIQETRGGVLVGAYPGPWGVASCGCNDQRNINLIGIGQDGNCYCRAGYYWDAGIGACQAPNYFLFAQPPPPM
jgi:hypothetical protein